MQRIAVRMEIKPGTEAEYLHRHQHLWPDMGAELKAAGCHNYSIFRDGVHLFAYLEVDDVNCYRNYLSTSDVAGKWETYMSDILIREVEPETNFPALLPEVYHLD